MTIDTNFNVNPYYDDFNEDKKFLRMLFKPGFAVQARELTQAQTILQKQVERFGTHVFKNGSLVTGGQIMLQDATYLNLESTYAATDINIDNFVGKTIVDNTVTPTKRAEVVKVYDADSGTGEPKTLLVKQIYGTSFTSGDTIYTSEDSPSLANIATSGVGTGQVISVNEGVFYYDGYFIKNDAQTIATSKYSKATADAKVGFEITESLVSSTADTSLLDPAQDASNYQAPGADRFKIELPLSTRSLSSTDTTQFIELARVESGELTQSVRFSFYSDLEDNLARRTYDESGNYTVRAFPIALETNASNTANVDIILSPGKAYIYGYEFETISPTRITVEKPRDFNSVQNKRLTADYGNFVYTNSHFGSFAINDLSTVDLHCVSNANINTASTAAISNTKIGTARVKSISYDSSSNISDDSTYEYKTFLFDISVNQSVTGNVNVATSTTVTIGDTGSGQIYSDVTDAYVGAKLRITTGNGSTEEPKTITDFDATTQTLTVTPAFTTTPDSASVFSIDFEFNDTESFATHSGTTIVNSADIDDRSKDFASTYEDVFLSDSTSSTLLVPIGQEYIRDGSITDFSYSYRRLYQSVAFSANVSATLSTDTGESLSTATTTSSRAENYQVVVTNAGTSSYTVGQTIPADVITDVDTVTKKLTVTGAQNMTANIIATIDFTSNSPEKAKTLVEANTTIQTTGGESINTNGVIVYASQGQTRIEANNLITTTGVAQSLYVSDVDELIAVYDFNGFTVTSANVTAEVYTDITSKYVLDNGQRDSFYNHASIKLRPGYSAPKGPIVILYNKYSSSGAGFFTVDSYPTYGTIPTFTSPKTGATYNLRDVYDFRPVRSDATAAIGTNVVFDVDSSTTGPKVPENGSDIIFDYAYYLPRIDKVVLNKNRTFEVIKGNSSLTPVPPKDKNNSMSLYILTNEAYGVDPKKTNVTYINNRRYTMRDIGNIEKRVQNLEYYTSLSLLEQDAISKQDLTILDSTNLPRFKNGILVDGFKGHSVADVSNSEYKAAIDIQNQELRPTFLSVNRKLFFSPGNSSAYNQSGPLITVDYTNTTFIDQELASKTLNVNPFNVINYIGKITLDPPSDTWVDTTKQPDVLVNLGGDNDIWDTLINEPQPQGGPLQDWAFENITLDPPASRFNGNHREEQFAVAEGLGSIRITIEGGGGTGATAVATAFNGNQDGSVSQRLRSMRLTNPGSGYTSPPRIKVEQLTGPSWATKAREWNNVFVYSPEGITSSDQFGFEWGAWETRWTGTETTSERVSGRFNGRRAIVENVTETTNDLQTRTGIATTVTVDTISQSLGDRVIDVSVIPYMREIAVLFVGSDFKPDTTLYPFFDNVGVETSVARANKFVLSDNNLSYNVEIGNAETINVVNTSTSTTAATCLGVRTSSNTLFVVNQQFIDPINVFAWGATANLEGTATGTTLSISEYYHYSGRANTATANTIVLSQEAFGATNEDTYSGTIINIVNGTGQGQQRTISSYNVSTRTATVSSAWTTTPDGSSIYSIGRLDTTRSGDTAGVFFIPKDTFRTGEKHFRLIDNSSGDLSSSATNGDASFFAQGLLQTVEDVIVSTTVPSVQRSVVTEERVVSSNRTSTNLVRYIDPLAQTFLVSSENFEQGIFMDRVRLCFSSKDETVPITLQVRPVINGYPSSTTIYPYGTVTLTPDKVNVTSSPDFDDDTKYTDFVFDAPLYLQPGEHSIVLLANSNKYETYVAEVGKLDLVSGLQISEQPYGGSLFLSQNGSTWNADQSSDMMFRIYRRVFSTNPATVTFVPRRYQANLNYDLIHTTTSDIVLPNTSVSYSFDSEKITGGTTGYKPITPLKNYAMNDGDGRRTFNSENTTSFALRGIMSTSNPDISPIIDTTRYSAIVIRNEINDLPLLNSGFVIENTGSGYANTDDVTITITGGGGSGATARANVVSNTIDYIEVTDGGSGYTGSPTITVTPGSGGGSDAVVTYNGEDKKSDGNSVVRYVTRKVNLADGFDSGDLRVYVTAYKPSGSNIHVYYKVLSASDPENFDDKNYTLMTELGNPNFVSTSDRDYRELAFAPGIERFANNNISYTVDDTSYNSFKTFSIKIVMSGTDSTDVPKVRDLRVIALPAEV